MSCTYDIVQNGCFVEIVEQPTGDIIQQLNLSTIVWVEVSDDNFILTDGDDNKFGNDIDLINGYATRALLFADLDTWRAACSLVPPGGGGTPATVNGTATYTTATGAGATTAGLHGVSITNVGSGNGTVLGTTIIPGQTVEWNCYYDHVALEMRMIPAISYDGTGTTLAIVTFI